MVINTKRCMAAFTSDIFSEAPLLTACFAADMHEQVVGQLPPDSRMQQLAPKDMVMEQQPRYEAAPAQTAQYMSDASAVLFDQSSGPIQVQHGLFAWSGPLQMLLSAKMR